MFWKKFANFWKWNNAPLQRKLLIAYCLIFAIIATALYSISYASLNAYSQAQLREESKNTCSAISYTLSQKMAGLENALALLVSNKSIENVLLDTYYSDYNFYYDMKYTFDSLVSAVKMLYPEIRGYSVYLDIPAKLVRGNFKPLSELDAAAQSPEGFLATASHLWQYDAPDGDIFLYGKLYSTSDIGSFAVIELQIDPARLFHDVVPLDLKNYRLEVRDGAQNLLFLQEDAHSSGTAGCVMSNSAALSPAGWTLTLQQSPDIVPFSAIMPQSGAILVAMLFLVCAFAVSLILARSLVRRIMRLNRHISTMADSEFTQQIPCEETDEIGSIAHCVNEMAAKTRRLIQENYSSRLMQKEAEIKMLQAQINPHFLYNTLSALNWNAIRHGDMENSEIITSMSAFYREALNVGSITTTIHDELTFLESYLRIRRLTCGHAFTVEIAVSDALAEYELPRILLQPIVENAIDHGIEANPAGEEGNIRIEAQEDGDDIVFTITDNGPGMPEDRLAAMLASPPTSHGLSNVNERCHLFFAEEYGVSLRNRQPHGLIVQVRVPKYVSL